MAKRTLLEKTLESWGFEFRRKNHEDPKKNNRSFAPPINTDGAQVITTVGGRGAAMFTSHLDYGSSTLDERIQIERYREVAQGQDVCDAVDKIVNEAIVMDNEEYPISIVLDEVKSSAASGGTKKAIREEFINLMDLLHFRQTGWDIFRKWYVDGRLVYHKIIDDSFKDKGIKELRYIDPRKITKIRLLQADNRPIQQPSSTMVGASMMGSVTRIYDNYEEFFIYNEEGIQKAPGQVPGGLRIAADTITFATSGIIDPASGTVLSHLHRAIKPYNQLRMLEDAVVVYRLARAPERRTFYIDTAGMQTQVAEAYMDKVIAALKQDVRYDTATGEIINQRKFMTMLEDYFLPQRDGQGTKVENLPGGENLGEMEDVKYFLIKLYRALNIPPSRITQQDSIFSSGRPDTISRDELEFNRFINRLRQKFATELFDDLLQSQLALKGICTVEEWREISQKVRYDFRTDNHFAEFKDSEIMDMRLSKLSEAMTAIDNGFMSRKQVRTKILRQSEDEQKQIDKEIEEEKKEAEDNPPPGRTNPTVGGPGDMGGMGGDPGMMGGDPGMMGGGMAGPAPGRGAPMNDQEMQESFRPLRRLHRRGGAK